MTDLAASPPSPHRSTIILIALCVHAGFGFVLFCLQTSQQAFEQATIILTEELPETRTALATQTANEPEWGEMLARQGNFGIPQASQLQDLPQEDPKSTVESSPEQPRKSSQDSTSLETKQMTDEPSANAEAPTSLSANADPSPSGRTDLSTTRSKAYRGDSAHSGSESVFHHTPLTLAQIGQGFLAQTKHNGTYGVTMEGKKGSRITDEQIKVERYVERLTWCLQNSLRLQRSNIEPLVHTDMSVYVFLELERSGSIRRVELIKGSGSPQLDQHTLAVFRDAGSSFPPVPTYLTLTPFAINYHVEYGTTPGTPLHLSFSR